jgi:hypothetical protein
MSERTDIIQQIVVLKAEREHLLDREEFLNAVFWLLPDGPAIYAIGAELDETLEALDAGSDKIAGLRAELDELDEDQALRESRLDREWGAWVTGP